MTIVSSVPRGEQIELSCRNHIEKRWSTKNIDYIGARSIFYNLQNDPNMGPECDCPLCFLFTIKQP